MKKNTTLILSLFILDILFKIDNEKYFYDDTKK